MGYTDFEREVARCEGFDIISNDHGGLAMGGAFNYNGGGQGLGYVIDIDFVKRFMEVFGVERLRDVNGKACLVTHSHDDIKLIEPLLPNEGTTFDIHAWSKNLKEKASK
jgi:hypothetical protein